MQFIQKISPCLWFDHQAEEAARFYVSVFKNSKITGITRYGDEGRDVHGMPAGTVMTVAFELEGLPFVALNGGPHFKFNEAISLQIYCDNQQEVDHYWDKLTAGGDPKAQQCGWLKDRYGLSWQVTPKALIELISSPDPKTSQRAMKVMLQMKKFDIRSIQEAVAQG